MRACKNSSGCDAKRVSKKLCRHCVQCIMKMTRRKRSETLGIYNRDRESGGNYDDRIAPRAGPVLRYPITESNLNFWATLHVRIYHFTNVLLNFHRLTTRRTTLSTESQPKSTYYQMVLVVEPQRNMQALTSPLNHQ
jgi:hypothetical protein